MQKDDGSWKDLARRRVKRAERRDIWAKVGGVTFVFVWAVMCIGLVYAAIHFITKFW